MNWWANLLQGAISAVISGVVAALTAWLVVRATRQNDRRLALEMESRAAAMRLIGACSALIDRFSSISDDQWAAEGPALSVSFHADVLSAAACIASVDVTFADQLVKDLEDVEAVLGELMAASTRGVEAAGTVAPRFAETFMPFRNSVLNWLASRQV
ncbi:hypothetical protein [Nonomuraea zeae]|uniref:DUF4760 domain-containing protein n=1 Tax=Nonomuraea zeae TaxID=1642303 RepID=A0A5S4GS22_9ACTN|nr:hypothetical protein [Nonomuraea zeae]TMR35758.1 hypothetical protein ETD85_12680 [Nonomuraea zeae]